MNVPSLDRSVVSCIIFLMVRLGFSQITIEPMTAATLCGSATLSVDYTVADSFGPGNIFSVELSDVSGSFAGASVIGSVVSTSSGTVQCDFPPGISAGSGVAIRIVATEPVAQSAPYTLPITTVVPANAGLSNVLMFCATGASVVLIDHVAGMPDTDGTWTAPDASAHDGIFDPSSDPAGCYTYMVTAPAPCSNDFSMHCITVAQAPDAGISSTDTVCVTDAPFSLLDRLDGSPQAGGTWASMGAPHSPVFFPTTDPPGCFSYTVAGIAPCPAATSVVCIVVDDCLTTAVQNDQEPASAFYFVAGWGGDRPVVRVPADLSARATIAMVDMAGRTVYDGKVSAIGLGSSITLDLTACSTGFYTITLHDRERSWSLRMWKE